jgi:formamidopyrimidine-DNA glycosylase
MPELPEVQTTVNGLKQHIVGLAIKDVWTNYNSPYWKGSETIKDPVYFKHFKKEVAGHKVISVERRAKNILINLDSGSTILIHMKMTGHLLYGRYEFTRTNKKDPWEAVEPEALKDPFNKHVRFVITFNNERHLALSDVRKFAKVVLISTDVLHDSLHLNKIGPEPLEKDFTLKRFEARIELRPRGKIKQVLIDQSIIAGIGNIYADESLWRAGIHPLEHVSNIPPAKRKALFDAIKKTLARGIDFGGDSTSDYRNVLGEKGKFHESHYAYQQTGKKCSKKVCRGIIERIVVGSRATHFCPVHQKLIK